MSKTLIAEAREYARANPRPLSPCIDQTSDEIASYYRSAPVGGQAIVRQTQEHMLRYTVAEIEGCNPAIGRVYIVGHGAFYMKHGKNCFHPKGQTMLVVPTKAVLAWAAEHPQGEFGFATYRESDLPFQ